MPLSKSIKSPVLIFWIKRYLGLMVFSTLFRFFECLYYYKLFMAEPAELLKTLACGFLFDSCVASILLFSIFLIITVITSAKSGSRRLFVAAYTIVMLFNAFNFLHVVNFGASFNYYSLQQLNMPVIKSIVANPQFYLAVLALCVGFYALKKLLKIPPIPDSAHWKAESFGVAVFLFLGSFLFLPFPLYYYCNISANSTINELPKNGLFSYVSSVKTMLLASDLIEDTQEISLEDAINVTAQNLSNVKEIKNGKIIRTVSADPDFTGYKHVIVIVMESMGSNAFNDSIAPCLSQFTKEGLYYSNCKATGPRTQMAVSSILTGVPNTIGINYYRRKGLYKIETIADYLSPLHYACYYIHNGYLEYDNTDKLLLQGGFSHLMDANSMTACKQKNSWGVDDEALYLKTIENIDATSHLKTLHILQTMTNHEPFDIPEDFKAAHKHISKWNKKLQAYYYADHMAGKFLRYLQSRPDFDSTLVFVTGDHGEAYQENDLSYKIFHVPLIVLNGKIKPQTIDYDCSHMDIPYTILGACGYQQETIMFGENLFSLKPNRMILSSNYNATLNLKTHDTLYRYSFEKHSEKVLKLNSQQREESDIDLQNQKTMERMKTAAFANYKLVRDYLLSGKINR